MSLLRITWKRSFIGCNQRQRKVIRSLGLRRLSQSVVHMDSPTIRGMINKVHHLVEAQNIGEGWGSMPSPGKSGKGPVAQAGVIPETETRGEGRDLPT